MTTILAVIAGVVFYNKSMWFSLAAIFFVGSIQAYSKHIMLLHHRSNSGKGFSSIDAAILIPDRVTSLNMWSSFIVYGLFILSVYKYIV